jgi:hypothetical protein
VDRGAGAAGVACVFFSILYEMVCGAWSRYVESGAPPEGWHVWRNCIYAYLKRVRRAVFLKLGGGDVKRAASHPVWGRYYHLTEFKYVVARWWRVGWRSNNLILLYCGGSAPEKDRERFRREVV